MILSSLSQPLWTWEDYSWPQILTTWRFWMRALRPILCVSVGSSATTAFCSGRVTEGFRIFRLLRDFDLEAVALMRYFTRRTFLRVSRETRANSLLTCSRRIFQRHCVWSAQDALGEQLHFS